MKVVAVREGIYNNILREIGEVFTLLNFADGSFPPKLKFVPKIDKATGKASVTGDGEWVEDKDRDGKLIHADFAEYHGIKSVRVGPMAGNTWEDGWMTRVSDSIPDGMYPEGTEFQNERMQLPQPRRRVIRQLDDRCAPYLKDYGTPPSAA